MTKCPYCGCAMPTPVWKYCNKKECKEQHEIALKIRKQEKLANNN